MIRCGRSAACARSLQLGDVTERLHAQGALPVGSTRAKFGRLIAAERNRIAGIVRQAGIRIE